MTMISLIDSELVFIERKAFGPNHIARKLSGDTRFYTYCGRAWHRQGVSEWTARESPDNDPDTFVCRACKKYVPSDLIRIEDDEHPRPAHDR